MAEGDLALFRGDLTRALWCLQELEETPINKANPWAIAWVYLLRGQVALAKNNYAQARAEFEEVISWRSRWPAINYTALFLNYAAQAALKAQEFDDAIHYFDDARSLTRELGNLNGMAYAYYNMAYAARLRGDPHQARMLLIENLNYNESIDHFAGSLICLSGFADLAIQKRQFDRAAQLAGYVREHYKSTYNTIFSLRRVEPEILVESLKNLNNFAQLDSLLSEGSQITLHEAIKLALQA